MKKKSDIEITEAGESVLLEGKWKYRENYGYGMAEGELILEQDGEKISGKIIFTDKVEEESPYMIQELVRGEIDENKVKLKAYDFDIIDSDHDVHYELDNWFGIIVDHNTIKGVSRDNQEVEGSFVFERMN
ncbi:hypothetical protein LJB94_00985 [Odoribacter sp. OttesenSCG-928-G04]|nr:hypothetical protein [Odoribacter sp. OttesenSCG-928-G04]